MTEHCQTSTMERFAKNSYLAHFLAQSQKIKQIHPSKISIFSKESFSYISGEGPPPAPPPPKKFILTRKKAFLRFPETETSKKIFIFQEKELSYNSGKVYSEP